MKKTCLLIFSVVSFILLSFAQANTDEHMQMPYVPILLLKGPKVPIITSIIISGPADVFENSGTQYNCTAFFSNGHVLDVTHLTAWSENSKNSSIDSSGYLTTGAVNADQSFTITADYGGFTDTHTVNNVNIVPSSLIISGPYQVFENSGAQYASYLMYNDGNYSNVTGSTTWSEDKSYTSISSTAYLTTGAVGANLPATITASYGSFNDTHTLTVINIPPTVVSLEIVGPNQINEGLGAQYTCSATYNNNSVVDVTNYATWSESGANTTINSTGYLSSTLLSTNSASTITASYGGFTDTHPVTIVNVPLERHTFQGSSTTGYKYIPNSPYAEFPGLSGFKLDFTNGDHQISHIEAGYSHGVLPTGQTGYRIAAVYSDKNFDDPFYYTINRLSLPPGTTRHQAAGHSINWVYDEVIQQAGYQGVPVLMGFALYDRYANSDHHVDDIRVRIFENQLGQLELNISYTSERATTEFNYAVAYALVPEEAVITSGTIVGTSNGGSDIESLNANQPILQGFEFDFTNSNHHLDQIGVRLDPGSPGGAIVWYNDKNDDDDFTWQIWYVDMD